MNDASTFSIRASCLHRWLGRIAFALISVALTGVILAAETDAKKPVKTATRKPATVPQGAGSGIVTQVQRQMERGEPSEEEQQHITVLSAQLLHQIARARRAIDADDKAAAEEAIGKAQTALKLVRQMLPKSVISTTVTDPAGTVLYEDVEDVLQDHVTVSRSFTAIDVVRPIVESKKEASEVAREFQANAVLEADVVVNLGYVDRRLREAARTLATNLDRADEALAQAQDQGTSLLVTAMESPLDEAREALQYAHRAAESKQYRVAEANLRIAREYLLLYREAAPESAKDEIDELNKEMDAIAKEIADTSSTSHAETTARVKRFLERVESWWRKRGQP